MTSLDLNSQAVTHAHGAAPRSRLAQTTAALRHAPAAMSAFARDVLGGLTQARKTIPCTWLYDFRGSELFEDITHLAEYYPTRAEISILQRCAPRVSTAVGEGATVVELGSGSSRKTPLLLGALHSPCRYIPIDISEDFLAESAAILRHRFPALDVQPVARDFTTLDDLPIPLPPAAQSGLRLGFFPGSTIGNFAPHAACSLLARLGRLLGPGAMLLIGADATQDPAVLLPAYDDRLGVTAAFNKNLLVRINRELGADFDLTGFRHEARYDARRQRVEMHLVSRYEQRVELLGHRVQFASGESIHTENSYKLRAPRFLALARRAGWHALESYVDRESNFVVHLLQRPAGLLI